jgi:hypothetical protein
MLCGKLLALRREADTGRLLRHFMGASFYDVALLLVGDYGLGMDHLFIRRAVLLTPP